MILCLRNTEEVEQSDVESVDSIVEPSDYMLRYNMTEYAREKFDSMKSQYVDRKLAEDFSSGIRVAMRNPESEKLNICQRLSRAI